MKKIMTVAFAMMAVMAFTVAPAFAGANCSAAKKTAATASSCGAKAEMTTASAKDKNCTDMTACAAKKMEMTKAEFTKAVADGKMALHTISIKGMTCAGCEGSVKSALEKVEGVKSVVAVSHKDEVAYVCVDPAKANTTALTKAVTDKGYKAEIVPAVSKMNADGKACSKTCTAAEKAACADKK